MIPNLILKHYESIIFYLCLAFLLVSSVSCGRHTASSCRDCPQGRGSSWCHGDCRWDTATSTCTRKDSTEPPSVWSTKPISVDGTKAPRTRTPSGNYSGLQFNNPIHNNSVAPTNLLYEMEASWPVIGQCNVVVLLPSQKTDLFK